MGKVKEAIKLFNIMKENPKTMPNLITYNSLLDVAAKVGDVESTKMIFKEMIKQN